MKKIVNDLSRGASLDEIINVGYITALQIINN
jgi:phosphotransacetylase